MGSDRAIPEGYMTVGELAKKVGTTVRTLQYYDRKGLLSPSLQSEGGRRLYTHKDMFQLHQILSLKSLGFSLSDIKNCLTALETPADVANAFARQAAAIREKIKNLSESLKTIETLQKEVLEMETVDFKKYADIIVNLHMNNEFYWLIKHFDDQTLDYVRGRFDSNSGLTFLDNFSRLCDQAIELQKMNIPPEDEKAQNLAKEYWQMIMEFTEGDMSMIPKLMEVGQFEGMNNEWKQKLKLVIAYMEQALDIYFTKLGVNPLEGVDNE